VGTPLTAGVLPPQADDAELAREAEAGAAAELRAQLRSTQQRVAELEAKLEAKAAQADAHLCELRQQVPQLLLLHLRTSCVCVLGR
jgi:hypothetical protein